MTTKKSGGRTHGLSVAGTSKPKQVRLGDIASVRLATLMAEHGLNASEVIRELLLHPAAAEHLRDQAVLPRVAAPTLPNTHQ